MNGFVEVNLFGVYVAPVSVLIAIAWCMTVVLRRAAVRLNLLRHVWHPAAFTSGMFIIVLSGLILFVGR